MTHTARRIGRTLALVLPVVLVLSGTLAVSTVPWAGQASQSQMLTASAENVAAPAEPLAPQDVLREKLLTELQVKDPAVALTHLQREVEARPSLAEHCMSIARDLGRAAVDHYGPARAQRFSRPVCDTSFATGVSQQTMGH
ncbi:hypothetical protein NPS70_12300 [Streptomyces sp. C10-9-1]|uniref:Membrane protein n=1 Tax=Streptomyces sanyensis TaxID=568869 RepID=A0ABP9AAH9_9ACTN|nr:hypothetical protein [Streptomyces sp. C10-9-1]MCQ6553972.1 hypothetical protein [Streptomyces sp. C10-9-1]